MILCLLDGGAELHQDNHHLLLLLQRSILLLFYPHHLLLLHHHLSFHLHLLLSHPGFVNDELFLSDPGRTFPLVDFIVLILISSSSGHCYFSAHSISGHTSPDTTGADSSTPPRFVHPPLAGTPRSLAATMTSSIHATRALVPSYVDLLPHCKRFKDSISSEDSVKEDIDTDVLEDIEANAMAIEVAVERDVVTGVDACIDMEVDVEDEVENEVESNDRGTMEIGVDVVSGIDIPDGMFIPNDVERLEQARSLIAGGERASLLEQVASLETSNARLRGTMMMERARADRFWQRVRFMESELRQNCRFHYYDMMQFRRLETFAARRLGFRP
ncbi:hypothetical protein Tco_0770883 [Tanacetum coccineum]|uniref:Uncharacterized protein n=1 Tax=Tanacetum coccineum TaxID=301880 RepID=A0ABQ4ZEI3_9ASTR